MDFMDDMDRVGAYLHCPSSMQSMKSMLSIARRLPCISHAS
jgi:hypothetical protein